MNSNITIVNTISFNDKLSNIFICNTLIFPNVKFKKPNDNRKITKNVEMNEIRFKIILIYPYW